LDFETSTKDKLDVKNFSIDKTEPVAEVLALNEKRRWGRFEYYEDKDIGRLNFYVYMGGPMFLASEARSAKAAVHARNIGHRLRFSARA
jgi:hypothetical protein